MPATPSDQAGLEAIVLAAGQGKRMRSRLPKVLHELAGKPLLAHVLDAAAQLQPDCVHVVIGHGGQQVREALAERKTLQWVEQEQQRGTGHAVLQALPQVTSTAMVLVLLGDVPLVQADTLRACVAAADSKTMAFVTAEPANPAALGRVVRDEAGEVAAVVEFRDATPAQRAIGEINSGIMALPKVLLEELLSGLSTDNAQGEYYLTDIVAGARQRGLRVVGVPATSEHEVAGINDRAELIFFAPATPVRQFFHHPLDIVLAEFRRGRRVERDSSGAGAVGDCLAAAAGAVRDHR